MTRGLNHFLRGVLQPIEKPIFLVGCGKSGTTLLGTIFSIHSDLVPNTDLVFGNEEIQSHLNDLTDLNIHGPIAHEMEDKALWDRYFPIHDIELRIGKELVVFKNPLGLYSSKKLGGELAQNKKGRRYFSKQPFNTFRIHVLRELFPESKIIAIHRDGRDVVSSWGRESNRWQKFGGYEKAIEVFSRKWNEAVDHIEEFKVEVNVKTVRYEDLISSPKACIQELFDFCDLSFDESQYSNLKFQNRVGKWRTRIPAQFHVQLEKSCFRNLQRLNYED